MAALAVQSVADAGLDVQFASAAGGGDTVTASAFRAAGWETSVLAVVVRNGGGSGITVTVGTKDPVTVAAGGCAVIPIITGIGSVATAVAYSGVTSVTVAVVRLGG